MHAWKLLHLANCIFKPFSLFYAHLQYHSHPHLWPISVLIPQPLSLSNSLLCASVSLFSHLSPAVCLSPSAACGDTLYPTQVRKHYMARMSRSQFGYATCLEKTLRGLGTPKYVASCAKRSSQSISPWPIANHFLSLTVSSSFHLLILLALSFNLSSHTVFMIYCVLCTKLYYFKRN